MTKLKIFIYILLKEMVGKTLFKNDVIAYFISINSLLNLSNKCLITMFIMVLLSFIEL